LLSIKHAKDIRDMQNSEFDIISGTKAYVPKLKVGMTSTRYTMGKINYADKAHIYKKNEIAGAYTPNYGLSKRAVPSQAKNDTGSPIKYEPV
jgi:ribosomal protein S24E